MRFAIWIVSPQNYVHSEAFSEVAETVLYGLRALGHEARFSGPNRHADRTIILGGNLLFAPGDFTWANAIFYNLEQAGSPWLNNESTLSMLRRHEVWDYSAKNVEWFAQKGIAAKHVPIGYVPELARIGKSFTPDIDVLFYGSLNARRESILRQLELRGAKVHHTFGVYGAKRDELIARSKIVLNMHFYDAKIFEIARVSYLLANKICVVSEESRDVPEELKDAVTFLSYDKLVDECLELMHDSPRQAGLAVKGHKAFQKMPMIDYLRKVL